MMRREALSPFISDQGVLCSATLEAPPEYVGIQHANFLAMGASVFIGTKGLVHVWGRNDMTSSQYLGISWVVKDPDELIVEEYTDWTGWAPFYKKISPDDDHEFIGGRFDLNKPGDWTISIGLWMNPESPVMVASYDGVLCRVTEEYEGTIILKELEYDSVRGTIPVL